MGLTNKEKFMIQYAFELKSAIERYPAEYCYPVEDVPKVAAKMSIAFDKGSYNKDGRAIKATCKAFGIPYTYAGINAFLEGY